MPNEVVLAEPPVFYTLLKGQQKHLRDYLILLANAEGPHRRTFWENQIVGAFLGKPTQGEELQLLEQHFHVPDNPNLTKAMTGFWAMKLLTQRNLPENTDEIVQIIHQALHHGGRLIPNHYFDPVIISDYDVSEITQTITKITLLRYLTLNREAIMHFVTQNRAQVEQHYPLLLSLRGRWLRDQMLQYGEMISNPYHHVHYAGAPWSRIPAPISAPAQPNINPNSGRARATLPRQRPLTPWQQLWKAYRDESPKGDFNFLLSFYRTNKFFCSIKKRTKEPVKNAPFGTRLFYRLIFWLNIPLVLDTIYYQFWVLSCQTLKVSFDYLLGRSQQPLTSLAPAKKWCEFFLTVLFAPFILLIPLVLGVTSIPFNCLYLLLQKCFHRFFEAYPEISKFIKYFLNAFESWIKFNLFVHYLNQWSQFLGRVISLPSQWVTFAGPGSVVIGIGVAMAYFLHQLWEKNFEFQALIDNTFGTLINTVMNDPLTHLVSVAVLIVTPATFLCLIGARLLIGILTGNAFRDAEPALNTRTDNTAPRVQLNQRLNETPRRHARESEDNAANQNPVLHSNRANEQRTSNHSASNHTVRRHSPEIRSTPRARF